MLETSLPPELQRRREDYPLITGQAHYVDDLRASDGRPAILHMAVVRSPYAHAKIKSISLDVARALPGVVAAFSGAELVKNMPTLFSIPMPGLKKPERRPLAIGRVRYVGDPVAVVLAENLYAAEARKKKTKMALPQSARRSSSPTVSTFCMPTATPLC